MSLTTKFAEEVKRARREKGYTQEQLAELVDITPRSIQYIEAGAWMPHQETMLKLMAVLDMNASLFKRKCCSMYRYSLLKERKYHPDIGSYTTFGILCKGLTGTVIKASDVSTDRKSVQRLVDLCNRERLKPIHLLDVIEDFIMQN